MNLALYQFIFIFLRKKNKIILFWQYSHYRVNLGVLLFTIFFLNQSDIGSPWFRVLGYAHIWRHDVRKGKAWIVDSGRERGKCVDSGQDFGRDLPREAKQEKWS